jgi:hypothetical protein
LRGVAYEFSGNSGTRFTLNIDRFVAIAKFVRNLLAKECDQLIAGCVELKPTRDPIDTQSIDPWSLAVDGLPSNLLSRGK